MMDNLEWLRKEKELSVFHTGHRPKDLGRCYLREDDLFKVFEDKGLEVSRMLVRKGYRNFIYGGAQGWDQIAFFSGVRLREEHPEVKLVLALPFKQQVLSWVSKEMKKAALETLFDPYEWMADNLASTKNFWGKDSVKQYREMLRVADEVIWVDELLGYAVNGQAPDEYHPAKMSERNRFMVDFAKIGFALWNGNIKGGTAGCLKIAKAQQKPVVRLNPQDLKTSML